MPTLRMRELRRIGLPCSIFRHPNTLLYSQLRNAMRCQKYTKEL